MSMPKAQAMTVRQLKQQAARLAESVAIPAFWITDWLLHVLDKPPIFLVTEESYSLTVPELEQFNAGVTKMQQGTPLAYLTGQQQFWSLNFKVNVHTLIPRPDTETLVEQVLNWINTEDNAEISTAQCRHKSIKRLLDLGTGSGCIAISLAHELNQASWQVVAVDFSEQALKVARHNATANNIANIKFVQSSWYQHLATDPIQQFDVIVSNPPYIDEADTHLAGLLAEPISALSAPNHGLADIEHIIENAPQYLRSAGLLALEHGFDQGAAVRQLFVDTGFTKVKTILDFGGNERVTLGQLLSGANKFAP